MPKKFWQFRNQVADSAELLLYGDISDSSWWGDEVTPKTFADELNALGPLTSLTVRINSGGGDVFAAQTIGNLLEQHTAQVTARIDGLCASAATIIACHCDKVVAANDSTYMIHPVRMGIFDFADAVTLQQYISYMVRHTLATGCRVDKWAYTVPECGTIYCGVWWMPATLGYTAHHALLTGGQPGAFAVSPEFTGTLPVPATVGYSVCGALRSGGVATGYTANPEFAGTLPEEAQHGN